MRKVLGWAVALLAILIPLGFMFGLALIQAVAERNRWSPPDWLMWVVWLIAAASVIGTPVLIGVAMFGPRGRAIRQDHRARMRRLKDFELDGD